MWGRLPRCVALAPAEVPKEQSEDSYIQLQAPTETNMTYVCFKCFIIQWPFNKSGVVLPCAYGFIDSKRKLRYD